MAQERVINLEVKDNLKSFRQQLKEAQMDVITLSEKFGATSDAAIKAAKRAAELKDAIGDAKALTDAFNPDAKFNALSSSIGGVLNGMQAYEGALGLVGVSGEEVQQTLLKVQSAMALSQGIQGLAEARDSFRQLGGVIQDTFKGLKGAILASGIGAFIIAIGTIAAYWDDISKAIGLASEAQKTYNATLEDFQKGAQEAVQTTQKVGAAFDLAKAGVISKDEALQTYNETLGDSFGKATTLAEAERLYNEKADAYVDAMAKRARANALFSKSAELQAEALVQNQKDQVGFFDAFEIGITGFFDSAETRAAKIRKAQNQNAKEQSDRLNRQAQEIENLAKNELKSAEQTETAAGIKSEAEIKLENERKQRAEQQRQRAQAELDQLNEYIKAARKFNEDEARTAQEKEINDVQLKYAAQIALAKKYKKDFTDIQIAMQNEINDINVKYESERLAAEEEANAAEAQLKKDKADKDKQDIANIYQAAAMANYERQREEYEREKLLQASKVQLTKDGINLISELTSLFSAKNEKQARLQFNIQKGLSLASATVSAIEGTINAFKTASGSPLALINPAYPFIQAGVAGAFGAVSIAKIAKSRYEGGGGGTASLSTSGSGSSGGGGSVAASAPNFNIIGNSGNQLAQLNQQPIQAFVVSGQVTTQQALDRNRAQNATWG